MGANDLQQSLLDSIQLLSQKAANSTNAAITIKGEIVEELDSSTHQYSISYGGAIYKDVYSMSNASYTSSTIVWVLIPDGNFDNPKVILGAVAPSAIQYVTAEETDMYVPISENLFGSESSIDLRSWIDESKNVSIDTDNFGLIFKDYLDTYRNFLFTAYIKTEIDKDHQSRGNYGLVLNLPFLEKGTKGTTTEVWKSYVMDTSTIQGNPYAFNEYQRVNLYYEVDNTLTYDMARTPFIQAFTQDFGYIEPRTDIDYDIHIKNIAIKMVDVLSEADTTGYYLAVVASEGNYFLNGKYVNSKTLKPVLKINAKESDVTKWDCYWFVEDTSINVTSEGYHVLGGLGWKCVNKKINVAYDAEGHKTFQYVLNNYTLKVEDTDVASTLRYKCVLTKDEIIVSGSVRLKNLNSSIETSLLSATGSNSFVEGIGNVTLIARIYYPGVTDIDKPTISLSTAWQRFDRNGEFIDNDFYTINRYNDKVEIITATGDKLKCYETEISYPCSKLEKLNTINCSFYSTTIKDGTTVNNNLGTESIIVTTSANLTYGLTMAGGDVLYKYDADGDSPLVADYDGPASSRVKIIEPITFKVFKPDGKELNDIEYLYAQYKWSFPKNSMMKLSGYSSSQLKDLDQDDNYYYITGYGKSSVNYTILNTYNKKKSNNSVLLQINFDNCILNNSVNPKFLKDGEGGTNGSKYSTVLTYLDYAYGERDGEGRLRKLQAAYIGGIGWKLYNVETGSLVDFNSPKLDVVVYKDGDELESGYSVSWQMFDYITTEPCFGVVDGIISITDEWDDPTKVFCSIVECKVTIDEDSSTDSQEVIYAYYPIEISRLINDELITKVIPTLDGGYEEVVYASDGTNPQYDNTNPFECTNNLYNDDEGDLYDYDWSASANLKVPTGTSYISSIKPITKFDNGLRKNYVKVILTMSAAQRAEVQAEIDRLTGKINETQDLINFYQHNREHILDFAEKFSYNKYIECLDNSKTLLQYRFNMLNIIPSLKDILEEMNTYCKDRNIRIADFDYVYYYKYNDTLDNAYKHLYLLGYNYGLSSINNLNNVKIRLNESLITSNYGAAVTAQLKVFIQSWNSLIANKYQIDYVKLVEQVDGEYVLQPEWDALHALDLEITGAPLDTDIKYLANVHDNNDPAQEFVNLKEQLDGFAELIKDESNSLISYSAFVSDLLNPMQTVMQIYQNIEYQNKYYDDLDVNLNIELEDYKAQKISCETSLLPESADHIIHIKPIVMLFNRYEFGNINGWDGSKLYVDEVNNEYLLAPQVGAGTKKNGLFTGVLMGVKQFNKTDVQHIGLFGYGEGVQSYFMNAEDGSVIIGKSGPGQIISDPSNDKALLYSSNFWKNYKNDGKPTGYGSSNYNGQGMLIDLTTPEIRFGTGNFVVNAAGHITAKGGGTIAAWKISDDKLTSASNDTVLNSNGTIDCHNLIADRHGNIAGWSISSSKLTSRSGNTTLEDDGTINCNNLIANRSGSIGGWSISSSSLSANGITINSGGSIYAGGWSITGGGNATFNNITCNGVWNFGSGSNTWTSSGGYSFGWGGLNGNSYVTLGGAGYGANGIQVSAGGSSTVVSGTLYAQNGHIGGNFVVDGNVVASGINASNITTGTLSANRIAANSIKASHIDLGTLDTQYMKFRNHSIGVATGYILGSVPSLDKEYATIDGIKVVTSVSLSYGGASHFNFMGHS